MCGPSPSNNRDLTLTQHIGARVTATRWRGSFAAKDCVRGVTSVPCWLVRVRGAQTDLAPWWGPWSGPWWAPWSGLRAAMVDISVQLSGQSQRAAGRCPGRLSPLVVGALVGLLVGALAATSRYTVLDLL